MTGLKSHELVIFMAIKISRQFTKQLLSCQTVHTLKKKWVGETKKKKEWRSVAVMLERFFEAVLCASTHIDYLSLQMRVPKIR